MKITLIAAAAVSLALTSPFAMAEGPRASGGTAVPSSAQAALSTEAAPPHYEWQYHYVGRHPRFEGHWVLLR